MDLIKKHLPETFFAGLSSEERLKMLVKHWQRAIEVNQELEKKISKPCRNAGYKFFGGRMRIRKLRNHIKDKKWVKKMLGKLYAESEEIDNYRRFDCSDFFRGKISAEKNRKTYKKWYAQNIRHIKFLERCK